ncbi:hypothetical protein PJI17_27925 [Mycobacterium kansasii]
MAVAQSDDGGDVQGTVGGSVAAAAQTVSGPSPKTAVLLGAAARVSSSSCFRTVRVSVSRC